jgi:hypothetical protein
MRILILAASILALTAGAATAQSTPSTTDAPAAAGQQPQTDPKHTSPGATGAMGSEAGSVATSPQEVQKQSESAGESGKGATSPGTVGATPGSDPAQPKPK